MEGNFEECHFEYKNKKNVQAQTDRQQYISLNGSKVNSVETFLIQAILKR